MAGEVARTKKFFFTAQRVKDSLDAATRRNLSRFGAFTRRRIKSSLKYKDGPSAPGKPPHVHRHFTFRPKRGKKPAKPGKPQPVSLLRELQFFSYDPKTKSVVIGPAIGGSKSGAPRALEAGETARVGKRTFVIRPRPSAKPAFKIELQKIGGDWRNVMVNRRSAA